MTAAELIAKLHELSRYTPDMEVVAYDVDGDLVEIETVGCWAMYDDDNAFVILNRPEDKRQKFAGESKHD